MDLIEEFVTCQICLEVYNGNTRCPRMFSCGHSFCTLCIDKFIPDNSFCPLCKTYLNIMDLEFGKPINYSLKKLAEQYWNRNGKESSSDNITNVYNGLSQLEPQVDNFQSEGICSKHKILRRFRCRRCLLWVCGECVALNHKYCKILLVKEAIEGIKEETNEKLQKQMEVTIKNTEDVSCVLGYYTNILCEKMEESKHMKKNQIRKIACQWNQKIKEVSFMKKTLNYCLEKLESNTRATNAATCANVLEVIEKELTDRNKTLQEIDEEMVPHKCYVLKHGGNNLISHKNKLLFVIASSTTVFISTKGDDATSWGKLEVEEGKLRMHCFTQETPPSSALCLPVQIDKCLSLLPVNGSDSRKVFLQFASEGESVGEVIISLKETTSKAILQSFMGLTGSESIKGCRFNYKKTFMYMSSSRRITTDAESLKLLNEVGKKEWKEGEVGLLMWSGKAVTRFSLYIWTEESNHKQNWIPAGVVDQGLDVCKDVLLRRKRLKKIEIVGCGLILD